jgi:histidine phosphotransferase ChpT
MTISAVDLASLLCSRLCHDLLSPVGALSNGLELLTDEKDPQMRQRCFELLEQSARTSVNKLKFFRLAFGAAGGFGEQIDVGEARMLIMALAGDTGRVTLNWALGAQMLPRPAIKMLLNLAAIGLEALPRGGTLDIGAESRAGASEIAVRAAGPKIAFDQAIGRALDGSLKVSDITSRTAAAHMLHLLAQQSGGGLQYALADDALVMGAVLPNG